MLQVLSTMSKERVRGSLEQIVACPGQPAAPRRLKKTNHEIALILMKFLFEINFLSKFWVLPL